MGRPELTRDVGRIVGIWNCSMPSEPLTEGELALVLDKDPGRVLATDTGVVAATAHGDRGYIRLLAVMPEARRQGQGRALLAAAEDWLAGQAVATIRWGAEIPYYLWPGLDQAWDEAVGLANHAGYTVTGTGLNMTISTRLDVPATVHVDRIPEVDSRIHPLRDLVQQNWPSWLTEVNLAAHQGSLFVAFDGDRPVSFMAHSTLRRGWLGPMGTDPSYRQRGFGASVLQQACADLAARGFDTAEIAWVGPTDYFARLGAVPSRTFLSMLKTLPVPGHAAVGS